MEFLMPLAFESTTHGTIAFGFFNIDSDMLLLDRCFFFSTQFATWMTELARSPSGSPFTAVWEIYHINRPEEIGNLMNAIHGIEFSGFIGEVYKIFPFPENSSLFRQKPRGTATRPTIERIMSRFSMPEKIFFNVNGQGDKIHVGRYEFSRKVFQDMIVYVWLGGYPRWTDNSPPDYIQEMKELLDSSSHPAFEGISFKVR
jgi:hypothetical protein